MARRIVFNRIKPFVSRRQFTVAMSLDICTKVTSILSVFFLLADITKKGWYCVRINLYVRLDYNCAMISHNGKHL